MSYTKKKIPSEMKGRAVDGSQLEKFGPKAPF